LLFCTATEEEEEEAAAEEEEGLYLLLETRKRVQTNEAPKLSFSEFPKVNPHGVISGLLCSLILLGGALFY
jgi:hypothetical protein